MRLISHLAAVSAIAGLAFHSVAAHPGSTVLEPRRASSILIQPAGLPPLPAPSQGRTNGPLQPSAASSLNLDNIQSDILIGMKQNKELFFFFAITDVAQFKAKLRTDIHPLITTTAQILSVSTQPTTSVNIAFTQVGLTALNITDNIGDSLFAQGQEADAPSLGDPGTTNWVPQYLGKQIHGVFLLASDTVQNIDNQLANIQSILGNSITEIHRLAGAARPGSELGHEHFGFLDGISQPAVIGLDNPLPGQTPVPAGFFLMGEASDPITTRPAWVQDGSILAFRQLSQLVPEFDKFLVDNPIIEPNLTTQQGSALMGARMMGRWMSGAPVDLAPLFDDPQLAADPTRNNNFNFSHPGLNATDQSRCPFSAHIRKTAPRADLSPVDTRHHIIRAGLPYGPEVSPAEAAANQTTTERGLAFVAYQSNLANGFHFLQQIWANNVNFSRVGTGFDPIIGANAGQPRFVSGLNPSDPSAIITLVTDFVQSRGGEYFFIPPVSAINGTLSN